jgi:hypothetical protein
MTKRFSVVYALCCAAWIAWMIYTDIKMPDCLRLYGSMASVEPFLLCESGNRDSVFVHQAIGIGGIFATALICFATEVFEVGLARRVGGYFNGK